MADPATAAGLALAVAPLIISALENYEYTFQPIIIFSRRYRKEVEKFQKALKVQRVTFANECAFLLHSVTSDRGNVMVDNLNDPLWEDGNLESRLKDRLSDSYEGCVSALSLINDSLLDILKETKNLDIVLQKRQGMIDAEWLRRLRQRSKISFSKDRFDDKLDELESRIQGLHRIRKHVEHIQRTNDSPETIATARISHFLIERTVSSRLHEVLSSLWQCDTTEEHFANIRLDANETSSLKETLKVHFDIAWSCPSQDHNAAPLRLSIETLAAKIQSLESDDKKVLEIQHQLQSALRLSLESGSPTSKSSDDVTTIDATLRDLHSVPNLCHHLGQCLASDELECAGFLQKSKTFRHVIYTPRDPAPPIPSIKTLQDALEAAKTTIDGIPLSEKLQLASLLALAVLRFYATPWLDGQLRSEDVVFLNVQDFSQDPLQMPFLKSRVMTRASSTSQSLITHKSTLGVNSMTTLRSPVRDQTLYSLGVMLVELAYDSPLADLQLPEDDQGDPYTLYWAARRLGDRVWRKSGSTYADAVKICLYGGLGASTELDDAKVQQAFFDEVVKKLEKCAKAVSI